MAHQHKVKIKSGMTYYCSKQIALPLVEEFAYMTGDLNPVHMDSEFCFNKGMKSKIVHGALIISLVTSVVGMQFPGKGSIILSLSADFMIPAFIGDKLDIFMKVLSMQKNEGMGLETVKIKYKVKRIGKTLARGNVTVSVNYVE